MNKGSVQEWNRDGVNRFGSLAQEDDNSEDADNESSDDESDDDGNLLSIGEDLDQIPID